MRRPETPEDYRVMETPEVSQPLVVYICDRRKCENCNYPECKHTFDIKHAANFELMEPGGFYVEVEHGN